MVEIWKEVFLEREQKEHDMMFRHPWVPMFYNYVIAILLVMLTVSAVIWAVQIHIRLKADSLTATALADYQAEQAAEQDAIRNSEEAVYKREAETVAKALYGIRLFVDKYNYDESDLITYIRCMTNRADASGCSLEEVIRTENQFLGYYDQSPVLEEYYTVAYRAVREWHHETVKPCSSEYRFAELTEEGIFLKKDINADGYERRWQA